MFGVIALHATMPYITPGETGLADIVYDMGVISVPLFFMVSGYFLIPSKGEFSYCLKKALRYILFIVSIVVLGWLAYSVVYGFDGQTLYKWLTGTLLTHGPFGVFWYLWSIILCILLTPLLNRLYTRKATLYQVVLALLWMLCIFLSTRTLQGHPFEQQTPAILRIYAWLFFYMLGAQLHHIDIRVPHYFPVLLYAFVIFYMEYFDKQIGSEYASLFYLTIPVTFLCVTLFLYFKNLNIQHSRFIEQTSALFLPVYAIHNVIISFMPHFYDSLAIAPLVNWVVVSLLSAGIAFVVMKIPYVKRIFDVKTECQWHSCR